MSILSSEAQGSESSSSQSPSLYPNTNHGNLSPLPPLSFGSLRISDPLPSDRLSGSLASAAQDFAESPKEVIELGTLNGNTTLPRENRTPSQSRRKKSGAADSPGSLEGNGTRGNTPHSAGRRAQMTSGNHLLNFHYDPISRSRPQTRPPPPRKQRKLKPYNKDLFLQANYKFVVLDTGNRTADSLDPDKMLQWEDIICVTYSTPFPVQCPICLEYPLCPQITSCGHIFCFPCIIQYLYMGEEDHTGESYKRCPLCFVMVSPKDLYTIYIKNVRQYLVGDTIDFMLLTRQKDSWTLSQKYKEEKDTTPCCDSVIQDPFAKFTFTTDVNMSVRQAISDLDSWLARADSGLVDDLEKLPYVCAAMEHLEKRKKYWNEHRASANSNASGSVDGRTAANGSLSTTNGSGTNCNIHCLGTIFTDTSDQNKTADESNEQPDLYQSGKLDEFIEVHDTILSSSYDESNSQGHYSSFRDGKDKEFYSFYQAVDGQHIILHPLNMKCLLRYYGSYDSLPHSISGRILELETVTQSEATRRRYRYLSHFSLTTTFQLCEIDMTGVLPLDALLPFMDEVRKRENQRKQLARKEHKEKIKAEVEAASTTVAQFMPMASSFGQSSHIDSPQFSMDDFEALGSSAVMSSSPPIAGGRKLFSNVARLGFAAAHDSPALKIEETNAKHYSELGNDGASVTGSRSAGTASFANIISRAKSVEKLETPKANEIGKKGKKPSRVLLSTSGGRRY